MGEIQIQIFFVSHHSEWGYGTPGYHDDYDLLAYDPEHEITNGLWSWSGPNVRHVEFTAEHAAIVTACRAGQAVQKADAPTEVLRRSPDSYHRRRIHVLTPEQAAAVPGLDVLALAEERIAQAIRERDAAILRETARLERERERLEREEAERAAAEAARLEAERKARYYRPRGGQSRARRRKARLAARASA